MASGDFVIMPEIATVGDTFRALGTMANVSWHIVVRYADHYGAIKAGELSKQALARYSPQEAIHVQLRELEIPVVDRVLQTAPADESNIQQLALVIEFTQPPFLVFPAVRSSLDLKAPQAFSQLRSTAASTTSPMPRNDFVFLPEACTIGDTFRALSAASANLGWTVIVRCASGYRGIRADELAQQLIGQDLQTALKTPLRELPIPSLDTVPRDQLGDLAHINALTVVLEQERPVQLYDPARADQAAWQATSAAEQLVAAATHHYPDKHNDFVTVQADQAIEDVFRSLRLSNRGEGSHIVIEYGDRFCAIRAGELAERVMGGSEQNLKAPIGSLGIPDVSTVAQTRVGDWAKFGTHTLILEGGFPMALMQPATAATPSNTPQPPQSPIFRRTSPFERLMRTMDPQVVRGLESSATSITPQPQETSASARYVNTWLTGRIGGKAFTRKFTLARRRRYWLQLHIGPLLKESNIIAPRPIDPDLPPIPDEGLLLRIKLFSRDFRIENDSADVRLFKAGATERLHFAITAPDTTGAARLRVGIYYQNNLTQSIMLHAQIDDRESIQERDGNWAEVEYSLSEDWADITQLESRRVNVFVNDSPDGTHMVGIMGTSIEGSLDVGRDKMKEAVTEFRAKLLGIVMDKNGHYRYGGDNAGDEAQFINDLKTLAYVGNALFRSVFYREETIDFTREMRQALAGQQSAVIQIARLSSDFVFPWAGIYDRRLMIDREQNQVCLEPLKHTTVQKAMSACANCSHGDDPNIICLSGFWGFRHIVEQPVSVIKNGKPTSVVREVKTSGKLNTSVNVYTGDDFKLREKHQAWIAAQLEQMSGQVILADELKEIQQSLPQSQQLCYFYCHGGSTPDGKKPWLTVGRDEQLVPSNLSGLGLDEYWRFSNVRPLVFINACHSIEFTPEALSAFLPEFATAGASGIIGTEVTIFESLAVEFGQGLIRAFLDGEPIGQAIQRLRWQLLLKRNVLGLVYTPYCYADLRLVA